MICVVGLYQNKHFLGIMILFGWAGVFECAASPVDTSNALQAPMNYNVVEEYDQDKDDELLMKEIWGIGATVYKSIIDMSALYFNGVLLDTNQLYDHMMVDLGKNLFQVVKLLAWYGPKMMQNPRISWKIKAKKTAYMASFLMFFLLWSREISKQRKHKNMHEQEMLDASPYQPVGTVSCSEEVLSH